MGRGKSVEHQSFTFNRASTYKVIQDVEIRFKTCGMMLPASVD